jgi:hypothetical protein
MLQTGVCICVTLELTAECTTWLCRLVWQCNGCWSTWYTHTQQVQLHLTMQSPQRRSGAALRKVHSKPWQATQFVTQNVDQTIRPPSSVTERQGRCDALALVCLEWVFSRDAAAEWQTHAQCLDCACHCIGRVHATARAGTRACILDAVFALRLSDVARLLSRERLKRVNNVQLVSGELARAGADGAAVNH